MEHYYSENQESRENIKKIKQMIRGIDFEFFTSSGVFSKNKVDKGTLILAENMMIAKESKVLDMGCGIGILGIVAAKSGAQVMMTDVNKRAVKLAKMNSKLHNANAGIVQGNLYEKITDKDFDTIITNPPQTAGKQICFQLIEGSKQFLKTGGTFQLVARRNKGGESLSRKMEEVYGNVEVIGKKSGYWVYLSRK
jgi:16S rRNA (guanine1207-N2)-methyltransferase